MWQRRSNEIYRSSGGPFREAACQVREAFQEVQAQDSPHAPHSVVLWTK